MHWEGISSWDTQYWIIPVCIRAFKVGEVVHIFGEKACHPEHIRFAQGKLCEGSGSTGAEILRFAQDDSPDLLSSPLSGSLLSKHLRLWSLIDEAIAMCYIHSNETV
jgi:hypothetical protein